MKRKSSRITLLVLYILYYVWIRCSARLQVNLQLLILSISMTHMQREHATTCNATLGPHNEQKTVRVTGNKILRMQASVQKELHL